MAKEAIYLQRLSEIDRFEAGLLQDDIRLGRKLAVGGFGTVFKGDWIDGDTELPIVVKKVSPHSRPEIWCAGCSAGWRFLACHTLSKHTT